MVGGHPFRADARQVARVAAVVAAHDDREIAALGVEQLLQRVLAVLRGAADGLQRAVVVRQRRGAVAGEHGLADHLADGDRLAHQHGGLVRQADAPEIAVRVEAGRAGVPERCRELLAAGASADHVAQQPGLLRVEDHDVAPAVHGRGLGRGRLRLLVMQLAVDDRGEAVARVLAHLLPDVEHRAAGRVDQRAAPPLQPLQVRHRHAERRNDDDVVGDEVVHRFVRIAQKTNPRLAQAVVDLRVVDDLAGQVDAAVGEAAARLVGVADRAVDAVAEPELARQVHGEPPGPPAVAGVLDLVDKPAVVVAGQIASHRQFQVQALAVDVYRFVLVHRRSTAAVRTRAASESPPAGGCSTVRARRTPAGPPPAGRWLLSTIP